MVLTPQINGSAFQAANTPLPGQPHSLPQPTPGSRILLCAPCLHPSKLFCQSSRDPGIWDLQSDSRLSHFSLLPGSVTRQNMVYFSTAGCSRLRVNTESRVQTSRQRGWTPSCCDLADLSGGVSFLLHGSLKAGGIFPPKVVICIRTVS